MKILILLATGVIATSAFAFGVWSEQRLEFLLRNSGRFIESDHDEDDVEDIPNWERNALPLFQDVRE